MFASFVSFWTKLLEIDEPAASADLIKSLRNKKNWRYGFKKQKNKGTDPNNKNQGPYPKNKTNGILKT